MMTPEQRLLAEARPGSGSTARSVVGRIFLHCISIAVAAALYVAHEHFALRTESAPLALGCLLGAAGFGFAPVRAVIGELFVLEKKVLHLAHGVGGLLLAGLSLGGVVSGGPLLTHAALAPFAVMGAAQAVMHQDHPRTAEQAEALRRFASSLPEVEEFAKRGNLGSPENAARAIAIISDLLAKAQTLGETELRADPGFQSALRRVTARFGLTLGLDSIDKAIASLSANPAAASAVPGLRRQLAKVRQSAER